MTRVVVQVPATTANLGPGFDALGMALDVWNRFEFTFGGPLVSETKDVTIKVSCSGEGADELPQDATNLVVKALTLGLGTGKTIPALISLDVFNSVPLASGLGSSATAIVGGLAAARALRGNDLSREDIIALASQMEGHPDNVAPAVLGGLVVSVKDRQGHIESVTVTPPEKLKVCVAVPDFYLDTNRSRSHLPERVSREDAVFSLSRSALWVAAIATGRLDVLNLATEDVLHQPYRAALIPGLDDVFSAARSAGALGVALSGAGPSVAAFCDDDVGVNAVAESMRVTFRKVGVTARIIKTRPSNAGVQVEMGIEG